MKSETVWQICKDFEYEFWWESVLWFSSYEMTQYDREFCSKLIKLAVVAILSLRDLLLFLSLFAACFPCFEKVKVGWCDLHAVCLWIPPSWLLNAWTNLCETWYMYHGTELISTAYYINPSHQSLYLYVHPFSPQHGASSGCGWRRHPPGMEGSCEYIE
jgi:hypothetical protein